MNDKMKWMAAGALMLVAVLLSVWFFTGKKDPDFPDGLSFVCENCNFCFVLSAENFFRMYAGQKNASAFSCPNCNERAAVRSAICDQCGKPFALKPLMEMDSRCSACKNEDEKPETARAPE